MKRSLNGRHATTEIVEETAIVVMLGDPASAAKSCPRVAVRHHLRGVGSPPT